MRDVDLGNRGLSPGDNVADYIRDLLEPGNRLIIPGGTMSNPTQYWWGDAQIRKDGRNGDMAIVGDGQVEFESNDGTTRNFKCLQHDGFFAMRNVTWTGSGAAGDGYGLNGALSTTSRGSMEITNCRWPDGTQDRSDGHCWFIFDDHAGDILYDRCVIVGFGDNGIYGSAPGGAGDGNGSVRVENCYLKNNNISNVRLGSDGSYVAHSTLIQDGGAPREAGGAINASNVKIRRPGNIEVLDNHMIHENARRWSVSIHEGAAGADVHLEGNVMEHTSGYDVFHQPGMATITGSGNEFTGDADSSFPGHIFSCVNSGCTAPSDTFPWNRDGGGPDPVDGTEFEIVTPDGAPDIEYHFVADGPVSKTETSQDVWAGDNDSITDNGDGTYRVDGLTGDGFGDAYIVDGDITEWSDNGNPRSFTWGGSEVSLEELLGGSGGDEPEPARTADAGLLVAAGLGTYLAIRAAQQLQRQRNS